MKSIFAITSGAGNLFAAVSAVKSRQGSAVLKRTSKTASQSL